MSDMLPEGPTPPPAPPDRITPQVLPGVLDLLDLETLARERLDRGTFDYIAGGSWDEVTLADNVAAFQRRRLLPRVLRDVSRIDTSTTFLGSPVRQPFGIAPMAFQHLVHPDAELATARAAASAGVMFCLSTMASRSMEDVAGASDTTGAAGPTGLRWFQLYVHRDRSVSRDLVQRAAASGYRAIVVTVDLPVGGYRERDIRNAFPYPDVLGNFEALDSSGRPLVEVIGGLIDRTLSWDDLAWLRGLADLPLVVKGILDPRDAALAVSAGAAGVWVSNHGGRQLDRAPAPIDMLSDVVAAVSGGAEVYLDSGVRRGLDVVTALALGARGVFVGRPFDYALALAGSAGVARAIDLLASEVQRSTALLGARTVADLKPDMVLPPP